MLTVHDDIRSEGPLFNHDRTRFLSWRSAFTENWEERLRLLDAKTGKALVEFEGGGAASGAVFDSDESRILTWSYSAAQLWDAQTGNAIFEYKHPGSEFAAEFTRDPSRILCYSGNAARLCDAKTGETLAWFENGGQVTGAQLSRDEDHVLTWGEDGTLRWWDVSTDYAWPREFLLLRLQVRTKTQLDRLGEVKPLSYNEWLKRKRQYDQIRSEQVEPNQ